MHFYLEKNIEYIPSTEKILLISFFKPKFCNSLLELSCLTMICVHCSAECSDCKFDAYPLYPKDNIVCGKCVFKVMFLKHDCRITGIKYWLYDWSKYPQRHL